MNDGVNGGYESTSIELINSHGKINPTVFLTGRCSGGSRERKGLRYWLMIANNQTREVKEGGTPDIVGFAIGDRSTREQISPHRSGADLEERQRGRWERPVALLDDGDLAHERGVIDGTCLQSAFRANLTRRRRQDCHAQAGPHHRDRRHHVGGLACDDRKPAETEEGRVDDGAYARGRIRQHEWQIENVFQLDRTAFADRMGVRKHQAEMVLRLMQGFDLGLGDVAAGDSQVDLFDPNQLRDPTRHRVADHEAESWIAFAAREDHIRQHARRKRWQ